jgi:hypothetical protein
MAAKRAAKKAAKKVPRKAVKKAPKTTTKRFAKIVTAQAAVVPGGYGRDPRSGLLVPVGIQPPIKPTKLKKGLQDARRIIDGTIAEIMAPSDQYDIQSIELTLTFGVKGEFLGFGGSGGTSVKVRIGPPSKAAAN